MLTAEDFLAGDSFVMYLGDNLLRDGILEEVASFEAERPDASIMLTPVDDPGSYGVAELDGERVVALVEKPENPPSDLALVGVYLFSPSIIEAARGLKPSARGELEITEAIQVLIDRGSDVRSKVVTGWWKDTGQLDDMLEANRLVLDELEASDDGKVEDSKLEGRVAIGEGAIIRRSHVRGPVTIGAGALIEDAWIGPYTSVGERVQIRRSEVEHSIILSDCVVEDLPNRMEASLLGRRVRIVRGEGPARTLRLLVGDRSEIELI